jgi:hypothetical protein
MTQDRTGRQVPDRGRLDRGPWGGGDPGSVEGLLREDLVERDLAGMGPGPGVRDPEELQQPLYGPVLALVAVQRDIACGNPCSGKGFDEWAVFGIEDECVVTERTERVITR